MPWRTATSNLIAPASHMTDYEPRPFVASLKRSTNQISPACSFLPLATLGQVGEFCRAETPSWRRWQRSGHRRNRPSPISTSSRSPAPRSRRRCSRRGTGPCWPAAADARAARTRHGFRFRSGSGPEVAAAASPESPCPGRGGWSSGRRHSWRPGNRSKGNITTRIRETKRKKMQLLKSN